MKRENLIIILIIALVVIYFVSGKKEKFEDITTPFTYYLKTNEYFNANLVKQLDNIYYYLYVADNGNLSVTSDKSKALKFTNTPNKFEQIKNADTNKFLFISSANTWDDKIEYKGNWDATPGQKTHLMYDKTSQKIFTGNGNKYYYIYLESNKSLDKKEYNNNTPSNPVFSKFIYESI